MLGVCSLSSGQWEISNMGQLDLCFKEDMLARCGVDNSDWAVEIALAVDSRPA
jgi:hypothetical protein